MNTHGLDQSMAVTRAAQKLSAARADLDEGTRLGAGPPGMERSRDRLEAAELAYREAYRAYREAYRAYTNPFGVEKTV